jgi:hypothetical protein
LKTDDTLVRDYLAAVARETALLPAPARQELLADLGEHIEVALAQRPDDVREILAEIGDPRAIAATAMQEWGEARGPAGAGARGGAVGAGTGSAGAWREGGAGARSGGVADAGAWGGAPGAAPGGRRRAPAEVPLVLLLLADVLPYVSTMRLFSLISFVLLVTGLVMVCRSRHWDRGRKWTGLTLTVIVPTLAHIAWYTYFVSPDDVSAPEALRWTLIAVLFLVVAGGCAWLWRKRRI